MPWSESRVFEVFAVFLRLGLTSFGGPIAHLGYFREEFVARRAWLDDARYAQLLAICQFLPGPASSQMGFSIGLLRAGWPGAFAAFLGFTLPSALLMLAFAGFSVWLSSGVGAALAHGLMLVAIAVVAHGLLGMVRRLTLDAPRIAIAVLAAVLVLWIGTGWAQLLAIALGAVAGSWLQRGATEAAMAPLPLRYGPRLSMVLMACFAIALVAALLWPSQSPSMPAMAAAFYRAGALVFGGGHVVLPLLESSLVDSGWIPPDTFLASYGAAQAVPGPLFSIAAGLGAQVTTGSSPLASAGVALVAIFLPGLLLVSAVLPVWQRVSAWRGAAPALAGINAAVVGLLAAALYTPLWTDGVRGWGDVAIVAVALVLLLRLRNGAMWAVAWCAAAALAAHWLLQ